MSQEMTAPTSCALEGDYEAIPPSGGETALRPALDPAGFTSLTQQRPLCRWSRAWSEHSQFIL